MKRLLRRMRTEDDRGMVTAFVVITSMTLLFTAGLVFDGGRILAAKREALNVAESAARAGAQAIDQEAVRAGATDILDEGEAQNRVCAFLGRTDDYSCADAAVSFPGTNQVRVEITVTVNIAMLPGLDVADPTMTLGGEACVARGITGDEPSAQC